jgi:hypothetical protein
VNPYYEPERPTEPPKEKTYYCPVCGEENPEIYYLDEFRKIIGCDRCIRAEYASEWVADHED